MQETGRHERGLDPKSSGGEGIGRSPPLHGVRAIEVGEIWAGPYCGLMLGDLGAEVIKVESIQRTGRGALTPRATGKTPNPDEKPWNRNANFNALNRNKLGITLNLSDPRGVEGFKELVAASDIVYSNYSFGVMDRLGLGYEELRKVKPDLIMLLMPGFGNSGPYRRYRSMGMTIDAVTGHSSLRGYPDADLDSLTLVHHPDAVGGVTAAFAVGAALHYRARNGKGQLVDLSQGEAFLPHMGEIFLEEQMTGVPRERRGNSHPAMSPHGCYPCVGEDRWVTIAVRDEDEWRAFRRLVGDGRLEGGGRFDTLEGRVANRTELNAIVAGWTSTRDRYDVTALLQARGIPAGPVLDCCADAYDDPHLQARDFFQHVEHPEAGTHMLSGQMWKLAKTAGTTQAPAPCLGQHNGRVLGELLGWPLEVLAGMESELVIGTVPLAGSDMGGVRRARRGDHPL